MSESLSEDELAQLIRHGRINSSKSAKKRRPTKPSISEISPPSQPARIHEKEPAQESGFPKSAAKEPDPEWLRAQKEKAKRNIAAVRQDRQKQDEMREASRF